jgi:rod shape-determining protein MreD
MTPSKGHFAIIFSFVIALFLSILPLPQGINAFKPDWVGLVLVYWVMAIPERVGIFVGWFLGLLLDILYGSLLGLHAISLGLLAYLIQLLYHRLRFFSRWKQAVNVSIIIGIHMLIGLLLRQFVYSNPIQHDFSYWYPVFTSLLFWPWMFVILRDIRRRFLY